MPFPGDPRRAAGQGVFGGDFPPRLNVTLDMNSSGDVDEDVGDGGLEITRLPWVLTLLGFLGLLESVKPFNAVEIDTSRRLIVLGKGSPIRGGGWALVALEGQDMLVRERWGTGSFVDIQLSPGAGASSSVVLPYDDCGRLSWGLDLALMDRLWFAWVVFGRPYVFRVSGPRLVAKPFVEGWRVGCVP